MIPAEFDFLSDLIRQRSGISLTQDKSYLFKTRLEPVIARHALGSISGLITALKRQSASALCDDVVDAMTTNETLFFRDQTPFDAFARRILPRLIEARGKTGVIRIWSAAASTGQEAYSLAILANEARAKLGPIKIEIIATDVSQTALSRAESGRYNQFEVQRGMPIGMLAKYFTKIGDDWVITPDIRAMVKFRWFNLLDDYRTLGRFDLVLCRNVLIYFEFETKRLILSKIADVLADDGTLILGAAETVIGISEHFMMTQDVRGLYSKVTAQSGKAPTWPIAHSRAAVPSSTFSSASRKT